MFSGSTVSIFRGTQCATAEQGFTIFVLHGSPANLGESQWNIHQGEDNKYTQPNRHICREKSDTEW